MVKLLKGAEVVASLNDKIRQDVEKLKLQGIVPTLGIIRIGEQEDDVAYERSIMKTCADLGVSVKQFLLVKDVTQDNLLRTIEAMNNNIDIHGILMFRPLPKHLDETAACQAISPAKDVDGVTESSMTGVYTGKKQGFPPCTPQACMEILDYYQISCEGKKAVVIGRSLVVGKPAAMMLLGKNATVTICHTKTKDLPAVASEADILIVAAGRPKVVTKEYFKKGQVVLDVGIHVAADGKLCGDVSAEGAHDLLEAITPVPGGVGTVTTSVLIGHVIDAAKIIPAIRS